MEQVAAPKGLIHALLLDGRGHSNELSWAAVAEWQATQGCLWLHFDFEDPGAQQWLRQDSGLSEIAADALISTDTRPRTLNKGDNLLLALRGVNADQDSEHEEMISLRLWTDGQRLISTRRRRLRATTDVKELLAEGSGPSNATELLVEWIDRITWRMTEMVDAFDDEVLALENQVVEDDLAGVRSQLADLRKHAISIRRYLAPQREAMNRLINENLSWLDDTSRLRLREVNDQLIRHIEDIDEVRERAAIAQDELSTRVAEQMNNRSYVFTVVATIFLPLGFFTGLLGINVGGVPGVESESAFWIVVSICIITTAMLGIAFRMKRWL
ncbi:MAG: zinc transporter ZntB [Pseudomonadota bacterium]